MLRVMRTRFVCLKNICLAKNKVLGSGINVLMIILLGLSLRSQYDSCVFIKHDEGLHDIYLLLYVDDLVACKDKQEIVKIKVVLASEFEIKDLSEAKKILGMNIRRDKF